MGCKGNAARNRVLIAATQGGAHYSTCNENKTREKSWLVGFARDCPEWPISTGT